MVTVYVLYTVQCTQFQFAETYYAISRAVVIFLYHQKKKKRFVCPLAFQRLILNCSTAKTREVTVKRIREVENDGSTFLHDLDSFKHITRFLGLQSFNFLIFLYHQILLSISFPTQYYKLFYCKKTHKDTVKIVQPSPVTAFAQL